jgi:hypothetical protein
VLVLFGMLSLYLLSVGPACVLLDRGWISLETLQAVYWPLDHLPTRMLDWIDWYVQAWRGG